MFRSLTKWSLRTRVKRLFANLESLCSKSDMPCTADQLKRALADPTLDGDRICCNGNGEVAERGCDCATNYRPPQIDSDLRPVDRLCANFGCPNADHVVMMSDFKSSYAGPAEDVIQVPEHRSICYRNTTFLEQYVATHCPKDPYNCGHCVAGQSSYISGAANPDASPDMRACECSDPNTKSPACYLEYFQACAYVGGPCRQQSAIRCGTYGYEEHFPRAPEAAPMSWTGRHNVSIAFTDDVAAAVTQCRQAPPSLQCQWCGDNTVGICYNSSARDCRGNFTKSCTDNKGQPSGSCSITGQCYSMGIYGVGCCSYGTSHCGEYNRNQATCCRHGTQCRVNNGVPHCE